jgi:acetyl-CoA carboxylase carboxyltransferase component
MSVLMRTTRRGNLPANTLAPAPSHNGSHGSLADAGAARRNHGSLADAGAALSVAASRLQAFLDPDTFEPLRTAVSDGVVAGAARLDGRPVCVWAQEATHKGGSLGVAGAETIVRTIQRAHRAGVPVVGLTHSAGARLQEGVAALTAYGEIFHAQALARVPQVTLVLGTCAGGAAYSPALGDFVVMVGPEARMFLTGPKVVEQVMHERITADELGGARVQSANGVAHLYVDDDADAPAVLRELMDYLPSVLGGSLPVVPPANPPDGSPADPLPRTTRQVYDVRHVIAKLVDGGRLLELAGRWARNMVTAFARLEGRPVGVIANQPRYLGGAIDACASEKGAWFVNICDRLRIPLVVLVDTPGFLPGGKQERAGVIRHGASLLRAFSRATVPRLTITLRQAYGGAHIVMNSRGLGADLTLAWPGSDIGIMGARQAVAIVERRALAAGANADVLAERYTQEQLLAAVSAARGHIDEIIPPEQTRERLLGALALHG